MIIDGGRSQAPPDARVHRTVQNNSHSLTILHCMIVHNCDKYKGSAQHLNMNEDVANYFRSKFGAPSRKIMQWQPEKAAYKAGYRDDEIPSVVALITYIVAHEFRFGHLMLSAT